MQYCPAQIADRIFVVHRLDHIEQIVNGALRIPVQLDRIALARGPAQQIVQLGLAVRRDVAVGPVGPDQDFAGAVEVQHVVAESRRQQLRQVAQIRELRARRRRAEMIGDAHRELPVAPQLEHGLVTGRVHADPAAIDDAGDAKTVHLAEELARAVDLLVERRLRQLVEDFSERIAVAGDDAGRIVGAVAFELAAGRDIGVLADVQRGKRLRAQQQPVIEMLDVDRIVGRRRRHLGDGRPAFLLELLLGPAAGHDDPRAGFLGLRRLPDFFQRLLERGNADPVHLGAEGQRGADAMDMPVGKAGDHGAAAEVDQPGLVAGQFLHRRRGAGGQHPAAVRSPAPAAWKNPCRR